MARKKCSIIGEITDFDYHGNWGDFVSPRFVRAFLDTLTADDEAEIEINSPGGSVIQGIEIANAIKNCKAKIVAHVTGMAASMASVIMCACDSIELEEASFVMIHDPWSFAIGNAEEMRKQASVLDQMKTVIMSFYRGKFKKCGENDISALMSDETWFTANECFEKGLECSVISSDFRAAASIVGHKFAKMPEGAAKFLTSKDLTDEGRAEIDAAKEKAKAAAEAAKAEAEAAKTEACQLSSGSQALAPESESGDWEARYKGASKKINELQAKLDKAAIETVDYGTVTKERDQLREENVGLKAQLDAMTETADKAANAVKDFNDQVKGSGYEDLAALVGAVSGLKADLEKSGKDLAECRQQLDHLRQTRDLLTGGVLTAQTAETYEAKMAQAKTPEAREHLRELKRAGKIK